jgi:hypothetical protein
VALDGRETERERERSNLCLDQDFYVSEARE